MRWVGSGARGYPRLSHRYYALKAGWFKKKKARALGSNAPLPVCGDRHDRLARGARTC